MAVTPNPNDMSYQESLNEVKAKTEKELRLLQEVIQNAVYVFEAETGSRVISIERIYSRVTACSLESDLYWKIDTRLT